VFSKGLKGPCSLFDQRESEISFNGSINDREPTSGKGMEGEGDGG
jgi:hypothetical protein